LRYLDEIKAHSLQATPTLFHEVARLPPTVVCLSDDFG
jgi:hypothetical protein